MMWIERHGHLWAVRLVGGDKESKYIHVRYIPHASCQIPVSQHYWEMTEYQLQKYEIYELVLGLESRRGQARLSPIRTYIQF